MLQSLDPYTDYIAEDELEAFSIQTTGQYAGIGALIGLVNNKTVITDPYVGFPAHRAGLRVGDEFLAIDGVSVEGKPTSEVSTRLKGKPKSDVEVVVRRYGQPQPLQFRIQREKIKLTNVAYSNVLFTDIGYIKISDFTPGAGKEVEQALLKLKEQGAKKLIIDLRDNPGGLLHEAVNIVNVFIPKGKEVVATKGKVPEWNKSYLTLNTPVDVEIPLVVLVNQGSASASEIVAGALQDYDRAVLVGQRTFGKGLVQTTRPLAYNAQLKVTTAKYYIPSGRCIQALDYAHRKSDGSVTKVADSLKAKFKTASGRTVYDGGGLDPDIATPTAMAGTAVEQLMESGLLFEYASKYCGENAVPASMQNFKLTDEAYSAFAQWLSKQNFSYPSKLQEEAQQLVAAARQDNLYTELQAPLTELLTRIEANRKSDWIRYKADIAELLEFEIAYHYRLVAGQVELGLSRDRDLLEARNILSDVKAHSVMLLPRH
jgi:carboxyl-terminal processing protease